MFRTFIVSDNERGLLFRDGRLVRWLEPGKHRFLDLGRSIELQRLNIDLGFAAATPELLKIMPPGDGEELVVDHDELGLVTIDGRPSACLVPGRYVLWRLRADVNARTISTAAVLTAVPEDFWPLVPSTHLEVLNVHPYERVLLYSNGKLAHVLGDGAYGVHRHARRVSHVRVDLREREVPIVGQEVMTADKVSIRVNLIVKLRVVDAQKSVEAVTDLTTAIYSEAQMVARRYIAGFTVDQLLENRNQANESMRAALAPRAETWGAEILQLDVKDVVLPGEMKVILNRVIEAEKQAAANLILRREETAATRSLANTARLLEASPTLLRLKELEAWKEMAAHIDQLTIVAAPQDLVGLRLPAALAGRPKDTP
jgi:regulator of protease activity HflC (stomatin/prohibitin superfamily)